MTLIDRYLSAVKDNLPRKDQDDIINELSDNLHSRFEDEEAARGRPLQESEEVAILKGFGHPMAVAARYRGDERSVRFGRRLIGPELYPTYMKVLGANVVITLVFGAIAALVAGSPLFGSIYGVLVPLVMQFAIVTAIFVVIDRRYLRNPDGWDPRTITSTGPEVDVTTIDGLATQLIGPAHTRFVPITTSILEIGLLAVGLTVWLIIGIPARIGFMVPGPGWTEVWAPATVLYAASFVAPVVSLLRPTWTRFRVAARGLLDLAAVAVLGVSLALGNWLVLADPASATAEQVGLVEGVNAVIRITIAAAIIISAISAAFELRRFLRLSPRS